MKTKDIARFLSRPILDRSPQTPSKTVAIVVPLSDREALLPEEQVSLRHLRHFLGGYDTYYVVPRGLPLELEGFRRLEFSRKYFGSMLAHNRLMYLPKFYESFRDYKYILIYHLDSLVFADELLAWCETGVDFVGAPWLPCPEHPWITEPGVGNGGFALMKIESVLKVLDGRYRQEPLRFWKDLLDRNPSWFARHRGTSQSIHPKTALGRAVQRMWRSVEATEPNRVLNDIFWSRHATRYVPEFRVPEWTVALRFAFETSPRQLFELNGRRLPFGCHAWGRYDRAFWEPYLLREDL
jgi:hypothetical protein